jgi:hypothetical protein
VAAGQKARQLPPSSSRISAPGDIHCSSYLQTCKYASTPARTHSSIRMIGAKADVLSIYHQQSSSQHPAKSAAAHTCKHASTEAHTHTQQYQRNCHESRCPVNLPPAVVISAAGNMHCS